MTHIQTTQINRHINDTLANYTKENRQINDTHANYTDKQTYK